MTGYGQASVDLEQDGLVQRFRISIRSVNHRFLDLKLRLGRDLMGLEPGFKRLIKGQLHRGHIEVFVESEAEAGAQAAVGVDRALALEIKSALDGLRADLGIEREVTLRDVTSVSDVLMVRRRRIDPDAHREALAGCLGEALTALSDMRATEGARLAEDLQARIDALRQLRASIHASAPELVSAHRDRLRRRITELLDDGNNVDPGRLEQEVAYLAEKTDVAEEITRLGAHLDAFEAVLNQDGGAACGKKLEFLAVELLREVNTIGSKVGASDVTGAVIDAKCELEKVREQVANLE